MSEILNGQTCNTYLPSVEKETKPSSDGFRIYTFLFGINNKRIERFNPNLTRKTDMKNTKLILTLGAIFALAASAVNAAVSANSTTTYMSKYVNRGVYLGDDVVHSALTVEVNKVYLAVNSFLGTQQKELFDHEWDASLGLTVDDVLFAGTNLDVGVTGYFFPNGEISETQELYAGLSLPVLFLDVSGYAYYDTDTKVTTGILTVSNELDLAGPFSLFNGVSIGYTDTDNGVKYGFTQLDSGLVLALGESFSTSVGGSYTWSNDSDLFDISELSWNVSASYTF